MAKKISEEYPEGRPGYGEVKPRVRTRKDGTTYQTYEGCFNAEPKRGGLRKYVSDADKKKAQRLLRIEMNSVEAGTKAKQGKIPIGEVIDEYISDQDRRARHGDIANGTAIREAQELKRFSDKFRRIRLEEFENSEPIREELKAMRDKGYALWTVTVTKATLFRVFELAVRKGYTARNILRDHPIKLGKPPKRKNIASIEDARDVLDLLREERGQRGQVLTSINMYALFCLIIQTGMRPEEAFGLQVADITRYDRPHSPELLNIWGEALIRNVNTQDDGYRPIGELTKNDTVRSVYLARQTMEALDYVERYWQARRWSEGPGHQSYRDVQVKARISGYLKTSTEPLVPRQHGFLFTTRAGDAYDAHATPRLVQDIMVRAGKVETDPEGRVIIKGTGRPQAKYTLYSFRHMVATYNGQRLPTHIAAHSTGHTEKVFLGTYVHQRPEDRLRIAQAAGELATDLTATNLRQGSEKAQK